MIGVCGRSRSALGRTFTSFNEEREDYLSFVMRQIDSDSC